MRYDRALAALLLAALMSAPAVYAQQQPAPQTPPMLTDADKAAIKKLLDEAVVKSGDQPTRIVCSASSFSCSPAAVFISAASISIIEITDLKATQSLTVRLTTGETDDEGKALTVRRDYAAGSLPDKILVAVHRARRFRKTYDGSRRSSSVYAPVKEFLSKQSNSSAALAEDPSIAFIALGRSSTLSIQLSIDGQEPQTMVATLNYQRWFVDMGGFITFGFATDQELALEEVQPGQVQVLKKRRTDKLVPGTGIVLNFHPANYPAIALQFGLATSVDRAASYFAGAGYRLRELGPRTLATFAVGLAATQVKRFPDVRVGDIRPSTAPEVTTGKSRYTFGPYLSLSLGFSFGGNGQPAAPAPAAPAAPVE